jgi:hypothetical protein
VQSGSSPSREGLTAAPDQGGDGGVSATRKSTHRPQSGTPRRFLADGASGAALIVPGHDAPMLKMDFDCG